MSPKKQSKESTTAEAAGPRSRGTRPLGAAALATLIWAGVLLMKLPEIFGRHGSGGLLVAAVVGLVLGFTPLRRLLWIGAGLTMVLLLVVGFTPLINRPVRDWIRSDPEPLHPPDAVLVLSGFVSNDGHIDQEAVDRLLAGVNLAGRWRRPLVISTVRPRGHPGTTSALDQNRIIALAGDSLELYRTDSVNSTHDEALALAGLAKQHGWHSIAVVTSPIHSRRACATVQRTGFTVVCLPSESRNIALETMDGPADRLPAFGEWLYERLGWIKYSWRGWL